MGTSSELKVWILTRKAVRPLRYGDVRFRNVSAVPTCVNPVVEPDPKPEAWAVVAATILATLAFGVLCVGLFAWARFNYSPRVYRQHVTLSMLGYPEVLGGLLLAGLLFILIYPLIGLIVVFLYETLVASMVRVYQLPPVGRLHPNTFLLLVASWPVVVWAIPFLVLAWGIGGICRFYWK